MTKNDANQADDAIADLEADIRRQRDQAAAKLLDQVTWLIGNLQVFAAKLAKDGGEATFNSLGEVQARGSEIDRMTGELAVLEEMRRRVQVLREHRALRLGSTVKEDAR